MGKNRFGFLEPILRFCTQHKNKMVPNVLDGIENPPEQTLQH